MHRYMYVCTYLLLEETVKGLHPTLAEQTEPLSKEGGREDYHRSGWCNWGSYLTKEAIESEV